MKINRPLKFRLQAYILLMILIPFSGFGIIIDSLKPVKIVTGIQFSEGPAWHPDGYLVFSDITGDKIYKWDETNGLQTFVSSVGNPNGIAVSKKNDFVVCRHASHDIARMTESGTLTSIVSSYKGKRLNSPNDVTLSYLESIYFTDPDYGVAAQDRQLNFQGLYCVPYNSNSLILLDSTLVRPNGLTFGSDWRVLYVCESSTNKIYSFNLRSDTVLFEPAKDKKVFVTVAATGEIDGITSDVFGNIYVAYGDGGMKIYSKDAALLGTVIFPEKVRNMSFGGKYNNWLFVTAGTSIYKIDVRHYGNLIAPGLLGVPTDKSVIFNALSDRALDAYIMYGTDSTNLSLKTPTLSYPAGTPIEISLSGLNANSHYYYKFYQKMSSSSTFILSTSGNFWTQRVQGTNFSFAVEADPHLDEGSNFTTFRNTLKNALNLKPDFIIDLGDNFLTEKFPIFDQYYVENRNLLYRNFWDDVCKSMPLFLVNGNHEGELKWMSTNQADDMFNLATTQRKIYYPQPQPDGFYTGENIEEAFVGKRENYYAWTWGDALFVVIDPYSYSTKKSPDPWFFTLGKTQYDWFRQTLETSSAKYKFVFCHQIVGGKDALGRGGAEFADFYENGGKNADGTYGFDEKRPDWGKPLHQLMVENGVQIYFHGHDHFYAEQEKDGVIYQEVPQPSFPSYTVIDDAANFGYVNGTIMPNSGHLNVSISSDSARVDYIGGYHVNDTKNKLINGQIRRTYYVKANSITTGVDEQAIQKNIINAYQSNNWIYVNSSNIAKADINIISLTGQRICNLHSGEIKAGISVYNIPEFLSHGIYIVSIESNNQIITKKIVK